MMGPDVAAKVRRVLPLVGSPVAGEALAAARAVTRLLEAERLGWVDLAEHLAPAPVALFAPGAPPQGDRDLAAWLVVVDRCLAAPGFPFLAPREGDFLRSLRAQIVIRCMVPTDRQRSWLAALAARLDAV